MGRFALILLTVGLLLFGWFAIWGVKACDDEGGSPCHARFERDVWFGWAGMALIALALIAGLIACVRWLARRAARRRHPATR